MTKALTRRLLAAAALTLAGLAAQPLHAAEESYPRQNWTFGGVSGRFDPAQLQRGFQVYKEVCAACHSIKRVDFRNLAEPGGPAFPEASVKALAETYKVQDGPDDKGQMVERPARLSDPIPGPFKNDAEARVANNGALPPDLSLIPRARGNENVAPFYIQPFLMIRDVVNSYQEGGADYIYAVLTGYTDPPADVALGDGMSYNKAFPGHQIAMPPPLSDGIVSYQDGSPQTVDQYSRDVIAFLSWTADPRLDERKRMGLGVVIYLLITTVLVYFAKKRVWSRMH
jgi:cytochrome c1